MNKIFKYNIYDHFTNKILIPYKIIDIVNINDNIFFIDISFFSYYLSNFISSYFIKYAYFKKKYFKNQLN